ncbi:hypothetical protein DERF_003974 [Dermatophagoides farinae]|uniref:Uncharacterized protein n=1 Tax=Dermatophagoides farinae TaxID=6954 RepID=A0A922IF72_DERFA|nr:protein eyes shut-like isoform X2 [Dermatophagoides farinae]KAH7642766.1 hypothetical protein HUG17_5813 [Dermatophagoides farinae]KAH9530150.1 hypothetical protein DERF_003974 [Dermatophagoides farinae]
MSIESFYPFLIILIWLIVAIHTNNCPCINGICSSDQDDNPESIKCFCHDGFTGHDCSINFDECLPGRNPCQNDAICVNDVPEVRCICAAGMCGKYCEMEIDECHSNPCRNGATCIDKINGFECKCLKGYDGLQCEIDIDACHVDIIDDNKQTSNVRCHNGGTCKDGPGADYYCVCRSGFTGPNCETEINACDSSPCLNRGQCENYGQFNFKCNCPYGWSGKTCQQPLYKCNDSDKCQNNGLCMSNGQHGHFKCFCPPDFHGNQCQFKYDECQPNDCQNGATCLDQINGYSCHCPVGFSGELCSIINHNDINNNTAFIEPSISIVSTNTNIVPTIPVSVRSSSISVSIPSSSSSSSIVPNETSTIIIARPTAAIQIPLLLIPDEINVKDVNQIYAPSFDGSDSEIVFKMRRIKRSTSSVTMTIVSQNDEGTILHAYTNKYNLLVHVENNQIIVELNDENQNNLLQLESGSLIERLKPYRVKVDIISQPNRSVNVALELLQANNNNNNDDDNQLISSVSLQKQNLTVPCFEWFRLGRPPSNFDIDSFLKPFHGCIFNLKLNNEEMFVKDSFRATNITECLSNVCQQNPCRNNGVCRTLSSTSLDDRLWNCSCPKGFRGWLCQEIYCHSDYCFNGGLCLLGDLLDDSSNSNKHLCICPKGFLGSRCEFRMNLTFAAFNIGTNKSFVRYRLAYNIEEFFEIRFRFIAHPIEQRNGLLMFLSHISNPKNDNSTFIQDFVSLVYLDKILHLKLNMGQGERTLKTTTESNMTEQMVLFGRYRQLFWLLVIPSGMDSKLRPQVGQTFTVLHEKHSNIDPYLYVGGHDDWKTHPALYNLTGFKGCIYDIEIRISRQSDFIRIDENLIDNLANIDQCDLECT